MVLTFKKIVIIMIFLFPDKGLFKGFIIEEIKETTLDGNLMKSDLRRLKWKSNDVDSNFNYHTSPNSLERIKLKPMEIRTFIIKLSQL